MKRLTLDLATALHADPQPFTDLLVALDVAVLEAIATNHDVSVALRQQTQHRPHLVMGLARDRALRRVDGALVGHELAARRRALANGLVQRSRHTSRRAQP